jgi:hypothetical protein
VLYNGLGHYDDALAAAQRAGEDPREQVFSTWAAVELIEAATRAGVPEHAAGALETSRTAPGPAAAAGRWGCKPARER